MHEDNETRRVQDLANANGLKLTADGPSERGSAWWLKKIAEDGTTSERPEDWFGPYPTLSEAEQRIREITASDKGGV